MTNRSKQKGTAAESKVVDYLKKWWPNVERRALAGSADRGDIAGVPWVALEVKDCARHELAKWLDETTIERANADVPYGAAWFKRRGTTDPGKWFVLMDGDNLVRLLLALDVDRIRW